MAAYRARQKREQDLEDQNILFGRILGAADAPQQGQLSTPDQRRAMIQYSLMNPEGAERVYGVIEKLGDEDRRAAVNLVEDRARDAYVARNIENPSERRNFLANRANQIERSGGDASHTRELMDLPTNIQNAILDRQAVANISSLELMKERGIMDRLKFTESIKKEVQKGKDIEGKAEKLREQITKSPEMKTFNDVDSAYNRLESIFQNDEKSIQDFADQVKFNIDKNNISDTTKSIRAFGDVALIFNLMKMLDPASTVREGEYATAKNTGSAAQTIRNVYNQALSGEILSDNQRFAIRKQANNLYSAAVQGRERVLEDYRELGRDLEIPENLFILKSQRTKPSVDTQEMDVRDMDRNTRELEFDRLFDNLGS